MLIAQEVSPATLEPVIVTVAMKILYVITKASWGGAQKYVCELASAAKTAGHEVVIAYGEGGELVGQMQALGIRTVALGGLGRDVGVMRDWQAFGALRSVLSREEPDVIHLNSSKAGALGALAARLARVPRIIFTAHGWAFNEARPWWQKVIIYKIVWVTIALSHTTICVSEAVRRDVAWMPLVKKKLVVVYNGVHEPAYKTKEEARSVLWPGHGEGTWVGMLSELHPTKRVEDAIEAMRQVSGANLVVLGEGEEREKLEALIKAYGLEERVHFTGFIAGGASYLKAFDIFLHTSRTEALAYALIEAGLAGLPVVATNVGGLPEIVEDGTTGILVPAYSPAKVSEALTALMREPAHANTLGEALRAFCKERFNPERMCEATLALYTRAS
jgi:glycosyltransferase involved in cell wall biosynthesis